MTDLRQIALTIAEEELESPEFCIVYDHPDAEDLTHEEQLEILEIIQNCKVVLPDD